MDTRRKGILVCSLILFVISVLLILFYIACAGNECKFTPNVRAAPAWTSTLIMTISLFGILVSVKSRKAHTEVAFLAIVVVGFVASVLCIVFVGNVVHVHGLWRAMMATSGCLCVTLLVTSALIIYNLVKGAMDAAHEKQQTIHRDESSQQRQLKRGLKAPAGLTQSPPTHIYDNIGHTEDTPAGAGLPLSAGERSAGSAGEGRPGAGGGTSSSHSEPHIYQQYIAENPTAGDSHIYQQYIAENPTAGD